MTSYKPEVDGLRAVAVLLVVFFHLGFQTVRSGFVGVDVFFVISGFLITRLIRDEIERTGQFNASTFFARRIRRLFPALFVVLLISTLVAVILLSPASLQSFGGSLIHAVASLSNIYFWSESGYFSPDSSQKPLLHTWSLSVEEQFYLIWPFVLAFLIPRYKEKDVRLLIFALGVVSFILAIVVFHGVSVLGVKPGLSGIIQESKSAVFFLTPFRIFEFAIGASLVWSESKQPRSKWLEEVGLLLGLLLILWSATAFTKKTPFPSYSVLVPCVGAALVIQFGHARIFGAFLRHHWVVFIGLISYSIYLIHWPLIVFYKFYTLHELTEPEKLVLLIVTMGLSIVLYRYVETPFRRHPVFQSWSLSRLGFTASVVIIMLILPAANMWANDGWSWRLSENKRYITPEEYRWVSSQRYSLLSSEQGCNVFGGGGCKPHAPLQVLTVGNSHEIDAYNALMAQYGHRDDVNIISFGSDYGCAYVWRDDKVVNLEAGAEKCAEKASLLNDKEFLEKIDVIAFSAHKPFDWGRSFVDILSHIRAAYPHIGILFFSSYIDVRPRECTELVNRFGTADLCRAAEFVGYFGDKEREEVNNLSFTDGKFLFVDKIDLFCNARRLEECSVEYNNQLAFYDGDHLSLEFTKNLGRQMAERYSRQLESMGFPTK